MNFRFTEPLYELLHSKGFATLYISVCKKNLLDYLLNGVYDARNKRKHKNRGTRFWLDSPNNAMWLLSDAKFGNNLAVACDVLTDEVIQ